jgi:hypothetical protein
LVSDYHLFERDFLIASRLYFTRRGGRQIEQGLDGAPGAAAGTQLQHLA